MEKPTIGRIISEFAGGRNPYHGLWYGYSISKSIPALGCLATPGIVPDWWAFRKIE
jgi:hypothetical protein